MNPQEGKGAGRVSGPCAGYTMIEIKGTWQRGGFSGVIAENGSA
jgi:hypothetical protein